ncbi:MAG: hypothetical protein VW713_08090, partial [Alphaproteobacteria bacterium]
RGPCPAYQPADRHAAQRHEDVARGLPALGTWQGIYLFKQSTRHACARSCRIFPPSRSQQF